MELNFQSLSRAVEQAESWVSRLHAIPEASFCEYKTTEMIREVCRLIGVEPIDTGLDTGVLVYLDGGCAETVALRADIDAVNVEGGAQHLCGHDYHTATALGALAYLQEHREELEYNVAFVFQCAEENTAGAAALLEHGLWQRFPTRPCAVFGIHNRPELPVGTIGVHSGPLMAEKTDFRVTLTGKVGHGGAPEQCIDPILPAARLICDIPSLVSRETSPLDSAVCSVCSIHSGTEDNVAPLSAVMTGTIRTLRHETHLALKERLSTLADLTAREFRCQGEMEWIPRVPLLNNSDFLYPRAFRAAVDTVGREKVTDVTPCLGCEDFAVLSDDMPGFFFWVGSGGDTPYPWHNARFEVAPGYLAVAVELLVRLVVRQ